DKFGLQPLAVWIIASRLPEAGGKADRSTRPQFGKLADDVDGKIAIDSHECRIRGRRKIGYRLEGGDAMYFRTAGMNRPQGAGISHFQTLFDDVGAEGAAADDGHGSRAQ